MNTEVINQYGKKIDFETTVQYMDDDIRNRLNYYLAPCTEQEFFDAYAQAHVKQFGEEWELAKSNPVY